MRSSEAHEANLRRAIALAGDARGRGNHPFGAILVIDGAEAACAENTVLTERDPTAHAEMNLLRSLAGRFDAAALARAVLYASTEPCAMCSGGIYWIGIQSVVYGCSAGTLGALAGASLVIPCEAIFSRGKRAVQVLGPLLEDEAIVVHRGFW